MFERLDPYFQETPLLVMPDFKTGMQHYASPLVSINGQAVSEPKFAKWVRPIGLWDDSSAKSAESDLRILQQMMEGVARIAQTEIYNDATIRVQGDDKRVFRPHYAIVQQAIEGSEVSESDLKNVAEIREAIRAVVFASWEMYKEQKVAVDLVGMDTVKDILNMPFDKERFLRLHNFRKDEDGNPVLIDTRLLEPSRVARPARALTDFLIQFQHFGLQNLLNNCSVGSDKFNLEGGKPAIRELAEKCFVFTRRFQGA